MSLRVARLLIQGDSRSPDRHRAADQLCVPGKRHLPGRAVIHRAFGVAGRYVACGSPAQRTSARSRRPGCVGRCPCVDRRGSGSGMVEQRDVAGLHGTDNRQGLLWRRMDALRRPAGRFLYPGRRCKGDLQCVAAADLLLAQGGILLQHRVPGGFEMLRLYLFLSRGSEQDVEVVARYLQPLEKRWSGLRGHGLERNGLRGNGLRGNGLGHLQLEWRRSSRGSVPARRGGSRGEERLSLNPP